VFNNRSKLAIVNEATVSTSSTQYPWPWWPRVLRWKPLMSRDIVSELGNVAKCGSVLLGYVICQWRETSMRRDVRVSDMFMPSDVPYTVYYHWHDKHYSIFIHPQLAVN